jgi:hypothetical protein
VPINTDQITFAEAVSGYGENRQKARFSAIATTFAAAKRALAAMGGQTVTAAAAVIVIRNEAVAPAGDTLFPDFCPAQTWRVIQ